MIGIVDVEVQAANPQMPLCPFVAFVGSPSSVRVRNVPGNVGSWNITKVYVSANYPDNSIQSRECTRVGEIYVGTLPACNAVGKGANGFVVSADGVDENGNAVTGYVLGKGDLEILDADGAITPGVTTHYVHGLDEQPSDPHEYDIYKDGDTWKIYFDGAWGPLTPVPAALDDAVTRTSANGVKSSGIWSMIWGALSALPTGFTSLYDWVVSKLFEYRHKLDLNVYSRGNALVTFPDGFSVTYMDDTYVAPSGGETIEFYGPITSTAVPQYNLWVPYEYKDATDFDPQAQTVWCLFGDIGNSTPNSLMFRTGASYSIANWNTESPTLTLSNGEESGDHPTMVRPLGTTGDTLAKVSQMNTALNNKLDKSGGTMTGPLTIVRSGDNIKIDGSTIRFNDEYGNPTGGTIGGTDGGGNVTLPTSSGTIALVTDIPAVVAPSTSASDSGKAADAKATGDALALKANTGDLRYALGALIDISRYSEVISGETVYYGEATLADRTANLVGVAVALDELRVTIPPAVSGKVRDFGLLVAVGADQTALTAPALVPIAPTGETITMMNADGEMPTLADGTTTSTGSTVLYFTEIANGVFLVKGEQVEEVA